jgi:transposase-like protein
MRNATHQTRTNRTITIDFHNEATYGQLLGDGKAFVECVLAFVLALGFQLAHKATCRGGGCLTRHSHYARVRLGGLTIWRLQCTACKAVFTVLPHFVLRYRQMRPEVARDALLATHGGLSLELCAELYHISPMALYRLVCAFGHHKQHLDNLRRKDSLRGAETAEISVRLGNSSASHFEGSAHSLVTVLTRCGLPLPVYFLADEKHSRCLTDKVYLPTIVCGRVLWHLGYTEAASTAALTQSYREFQQAALQQEPAYRVRGILTDGFDSTTSSLRTLFPGARLGTCLRHALLKLPKKLVAITSPLRQALRTQFHTLWYRTRQRKGLRVFALGQRLRRFADHVTHTAGEANGHRVRQWFQAKKAGWYAVLADPQMPATSTLLDHTHNAIDRKLFMMKGFVRSVG